MADDDSGRSPVSSLVHEIGRAAQAGWAQTAPHDRTAGSCRRRSRTGPDDQQVVTTRTR